MRNYLIIIALLAGCTLLAPKNFKIPVCRHNAVYAALVYGEKYPVRIAHGYSIDRNGLRIKNSYHAQAQAFIDGIWKWLVIENCYVSVGTKDYWFVVERYVTIEEAIKWSKRR